MPGATERPGPTRGPVHRLPGHDSAVKGSVFVGQLLIKIDGQLTQCPGLPVTSGGQQGQVVSVDVHLLIDATRGPNGCSPAENDPAVGTLPRPCSSASPPDSLGFDRSSYKCASDRSGFRISVQG